MHRVSSQLTVTNVSHTLGQLVLGGDHHQRLRIGRSLIAAALYVACIGMMQTSVQLGLTDAHAANVATLYISIGPVLFYVLLRSGRNQRFSDPTLTQPQMLFGISSLLIAYAINPSTRAAVLLILALVMLFSMFSLSSRQARRLTAVSLLAFGIEMAALSHAQPQVFPSQVEGMNFMLLAAVLPTISALAGQLARLRVRRLEQHAALQQALVQLESLISHDELTGLANRRHMLEVLGRTLARRQLDPSPVCVCLLDLDHFKRINDNHGHAAGDEALRLFAQCVRATLRDIDLLARWGGEEFLLLLRATSAAQAATTIDRIRHSLAHSPLWRDRPELRLTMSAGIAAWREDDNVDTLIERADQAAYRAKAEGRDRWCMEAPDPKGQT